MTTITCANPECRAKNSPESHFCFECGMKLERKCHNCGGVLSEIGRFCPHCGTQLDQPPVPVGQTPQPDTANPASSPQPVLVTTPSDVPTKPYRKFRLQRLQLVSKLMHIMRGAHMFPTEDFSPTEVQAAICQMHDLVNATATDPLCLAAHQMVILSTLPVLISPKAAGIAVEDLPIIPIKDDQSKVIDNEYQSLLNKTKSGTLTFSPNPIQAELSFLCTVVGHGIQSDLGLFCFCHREGNTPYLVKFTDFLSLELAFKEDPKSFAGVIGQSLRERFYLHYPSVTQKKQLLQDEDIKINYGFYPDSIKSEIVSLYRKLDITVEKSERQIGQGDEKLEAMATVSPLSLPAIADASARIAAHMGVPGNPFPYRPLTPTEQAAFEKYFENGLLSGEDVFDFLLAMRDEQAAIINNWHAWIQQDTNRYGSFSAGEAIDFVDIVSHISYAHTYLTRSCNIYRDCFVPRNTDNSSLSLLQSPFFPFETIRENISKIDSEFSLALFPQHKPLETIVQEVPNAFLLPYPDLRPELEAFKKSYIGWN